MLEHELAALVAEVLGVPVDVDAGFAELGGDSLDAAQVLARMRVGFGCELSLCDLFEAVSLRELAWTAARRRTAPDQGQWLPPLRSTPEPEPLPTSGQQRLWFLDHLHAAAGAAYNVPVATWLRGPLDRAALREAIAAVAWRHEQLRAAFTLVDGRLTVQVGPERPRLDVVDLSGCPDPEREAVQRAARAAAEHMELDRAPLLRCVLYRVGPDCHLLTLVLHHVVADGWTVNVIDRELSMAYGEGGAACQRGAGGDHLEYRHFARWQRDLAGTPAMSRMLDYWRGQLAAAPTVLNLPTDRPRPPVRSYQGRRETRSAPAGLLADLRKYGAANNVTPYAVSLAALAVLLRGLTGGRDFLVASPTAGRPDPALEEVVGFFANTVVVRLRPESGTFRELIAAAHETALDAQERQYVPFEQLVAELAPPGDLSRPPLAQVALAYQGPRRPNASFRGLTVQPVELDNGTAKFDFTVELHEAAGELEVAAEYSTDLFTGESAVAMLDRFLSLLAAAVAEPDSPIAVYAPGPDSGPPAAAGRGRCLHEIFADAAANWPGRTAVTDDKRSLSYAELDQAANRLAHRLRAMGAGPEKLVGVCAERTVDLVVAILAVLKSGAGYLPLDPRYPAARLDFTLRDAGCRLLLGDDDACAPLAGAGRTFVRLAGHDDDVPAGPPPAAAGPDNLAYVIYTSGSTGTPKGIAVSHENVTRLFTATARHFSFGPDDVWTLFHSAAFDFSVWELWGALLHGGRLVVVPYGVSRAPEAFLDLIRAEQVTVLNQTPTAFRQLAAVAEDAGFPALALRAVIFGGEALNPATLQGWVAGYGTMRPRLFNMYGITETTVHVTIRPIGVPDLAAASSPIGVPLSDLSVHVLADDLTEVPPGVEGEMYVGGAGVSRGYLGRPALTAERFVPDPFGSLGARLYRTGDLAVRRTDGELEYRGRADSQVKLRGFRIELGEVEQALLGQADVRAAACVLREDTPGHPRLVAYVVPVPGQAPSAAVLRAALQARLPEHMLPAAYVMLPALPLTVNGKLDQALLPAPGATAGARPPQSRVSPGSAHEQALANIWSNVLGVPEPGVHDNFFTLGGDSILAVRTAAAARDAGMSITVEDVFLHPVISELAAKAAAQVAGDRPADVSTSLADIDPARVPAGVVAAYPTTAMQIGILFDCEMSEDRSLYRDLISVRLAGRFSEPALRQALAAACARHEALRTSFDFASFREPVQFVHGSAAVPLTVEAVDGQDSDAVLSGWWQAERGVSFDLSCPPLVRCHVHRFTEAWQLSLSVHHVLLDGWSLARLMTDVLLGYDAQLTATAGPPVPVPPGSYRDFVAAEQAAVADAGAERFWRQRVASLAGSPLPALPGTAAGPRAFRTAVSGVLDRRLRRVAGELGVPVKSAYFAAQMWALREVTGQADVVSGVQVNGRLEHQGADLALGLFLNIVPVHLAVAQATWTALIADAFAAEREVQRYRRYPGAKIQQLAGHGHVLFETVFNYTDFHVFHELGRLTAIRATDWHFSDRHSFPLLVEVTTAPGGDGRAVEVTTGALESMAGTGARLGRLIMQALDRIAADPGGRLQA